MQLLLSGASNFKTEQGDVNQSLGGYMSSTRVPNGKINSLFGDITQYGKSKKIEETIAVFLYNDSQEVVKNLVIQQIYDNKYGKEYKNVEFQFAVVEPKNNQFIELIGNKTERPYDAEFFNPDCKREFSIIEVTSPGKKGDVVEVMGRISKLEGNSIFDVTMAIFESFEDDMEFDVEVIEENKLYIERKELIQTNKKIELVSPGTAKIKKTKLSGGFDNGLLLIEELQPEQCLGIWIKRKVLKTSEKISNEELEERYDEMFGTDFSEESLDDLLETEENHQIIFTWDN